MTSAPGLTSLTRYHIAFILAYIALMVVLVIIALIFDGTRMTGVSSILPFLASMFVSEHFLKRERRFPSRSEKNKLIWGGLLIFIAFNVFFTAVMWITGTLDIEGLPSSEMIFAVLAGIFAVLVLLNYFLMRWVYGGLLGKRAKKLNIRDVDAFD